MPDSSVPVYRKISTKFVALSLVFSLVPLTILYLFSIDIASGILIRNIEKNLRDTAYQLSREIETFFNDRQHDVRILSQADVLEGETLVAIEQYLSEILKETPNLNVVTVVNTNGIVLARTKKEYPVGRNFAALYPDLRELLQDSVKRNQGDVLLSQALPLQNGPGLVYATPVTDDTNTRVIKILLAEISFAVIQRFIATQDNEEIGDNFVYILDRSGRVVASSNPEARFLSPFRDLSHIPELLDIESPRGRARNFTYRDTAGDEILASLAAVNVSGVNRLLGWRILTVSSKSSVLSPVSDLINEMLIFVLVVAAVTSIVVLLASGRIVRPILESAEVARRIANGEYDATVKITGPDEIGILTRSINQIGASFRESERARRQTQRMEAVGQLTGGVAHDFNNLLHVIIGNVELLEYKVSGDDEAGSWLGAIKRSVLRGSSLTARLLAFSRQQTLSPIATDVDELILSLEELLQRTLGETIDLKVEPFTELWPAQIDPSQFENALINLALNAKDAMPNGGKLVIETANIALDAVYAAQFEDVRIGEYVRVSVTDTGTGMTAEVLEKVFEPFFTTKEVGKGSGLGLSMVYGFTKQSDGHITIYSEVGHGTTVKLYLPRSGEVVVSQPSDADELEFANGSGRILVVEDDEGVRDIPVLILRNQGYDVVAVGNGKEAIDRLKSGQPFDLLFTDVVLPGGMNGVEIAEQAMRLQPGIKVLYTTGYTENAIIHNGKLDQGVILVNKPYMRAELLEKVTQILSGISVLLIEDDENLRETLLQGLENSGFSVTSASGGVDGFKLFKANKVDVVVLDVVMKDGEGVETLRWIQSSSADTPVIGISGNPKFLGILRSLGASATLAKPFAITDLTRTIRDVTRKRS